MIIELFGPVCGSRHDSFMLNDSNLLQRIEECFPFEDGKVYIPFMVTPHTQNLNFWSLALELHHGDQLWQNLINTFQSFEYQWNGHSRISQKYGNSLTSDFYVNS